MNRFPKLTFAFLIFAFLAFIASAQNQRDSFNRPRFFDARHYLIKTSFDKSEQRIFGETTVTLSPLGDGLRSVSLDAVDLKFDSVTLEPSGRALKFQTEDTSVSITLDRAYNARDTVRIRLKYSAKPKKGVRFVRAGSSDGKEHSAQIWTQGEAEYSRYWFPSYDFPDDRATTEQILTVDADETAVSNGELIGDKQNGDGTRTLHYRMNTPHPVYLTSFVVGKYVKLTDSYGEIPLGYYVYPGTEPIARLAFGNTPKIMSVFEGLTGVKFPFGKYDQTIVARFNLGGMENITATTYSDKEIFFVEKNRFVVEDIVAHELAHSWFGNLVTCQNWAELWLNEGFATFMVAAYREKMYGREEYIRKIREEADIYFLAELDMKRKRGLYNLLAVPDDSIFDGVTYQKGGVVIHMLRETIGDEAFWKAVNIYLKRHRLGNTTSEDLKKAFEEASKQDLTWFFDQWVYGTRFPRIEIQRDYDDRAGVLRLNVKQTQKTDELTVSAFRLPLDVEIKTAEGVVSEKILITKREQSFSLNVKSRPLSVVFDKDLRIPLKYLNASGQ